MTNFNLLPSEYQKSTVSFRRILLFTILTLLLLLIIKFGFLEPIQNKNQALQQLALLEKETAEYPDLEEEKFLQQSGMKELEERMRAFQEMKEGTPQYWEDVLSILEDTLPQNSHLSHFTCDNNIILIAGTSMNDKTSADYHRNLKASGCFSDVSMEKLVYQQGGEVHFTIRCTLHFISQEGLSREPI